MGVTPVNPEPFVLSGKQGREHTVFMVSAGSILLEYCYNFCSRHIRHSGNCAA